MKAFIVAVPDDPGEVARVAEAVAAKGINITSIAGIGWQGQGAIALTTNSAESRGSSASRKSATPAISTAIRKPARRICGST
jgi:hypothetical protein